MSVRRRARGGRGLPEGDPPQPTSTQTATFVRPTFGWSPADEYLAPPGSIVSGQNIWIDRGSLEPRSRLTTVPSSGTENATDNAAPVGTAMYYSIQGDSYPVVFSAGTVKYYASGSWTSLQFDSAQSNLPLDGNDRDPIYADVAYLPRLDTNYLLFTNYIDPIYCWAGPSVSTSYSILTEAPICRDLAMFDNRVVVVNTREFSSSSQFVQRVQWTVSGNPEDWDGIGSGFADLVDMHGQFLRIFHQDDELFLFGTEEIWRGRRVGGFDVFTFSRMANDIGLHHDGGIIHTEIGLVFLGSDLMIYTLSGGRLQPIGAAIQEDLRTNAKTMWKAFFSYNDEREQVTLYYPNAHYTDCNRGYTFHLKEPNIPVTPQQFPEPVAVSGTAFQESGATIWSAMTGTIAQNTMSFLELLDSTGRETETLVTSKGTVLEYHDSATSDDLSTALSQAAFGGLHTGDPFNDYFVTRVRLDVNSTTTSTVTVTLTGDLGNGQTSANALSIKLDSDSSQIDAHMGVPGQYHMLQIDGETPGWKLHNYVVQAHRIGETY